MTDDPRHFRDDAQDWELLASYLTGALDSAERTEVVERSKADAEFRDKLDAARELWDLAATSAAVPAAQVDTAWSRLSASIRPTSPPVAVRVPRRRSLRRRASAERRSRPIGRAFALACSVAILVLGGGLMWLSQRGVAPAGELVRARDVVAPPGKRIRVRFDDGSWVWLAPGSRLRAPARFGRDAREIELVGRAYFVVAHEPDRPFRVRAGSVVAHVLGTEFEVRASGGAIPARVVVRSGRVAVRPAKPSRAKARVLGRGDQATLDSTGTLRVQTNMDVESLLAWTEGRLVFRRTPLIDAIAELERWYAVEIDLADPALGARRITAAFADEPLDSVLPIIAEVSDARLERRNGRFVLTARP